MKFSVDFFKIKNDIVLFRGAPIHPRLPARQRLLPPLGPPRLRQVLQLRERRPPRAALPPGPHLRRHRQHVRLVRRQQPQRLQERQAR
jgi:hypothetical protein